MLHNNTVDIDGPVYKVLPIAECQVKNNWKVLREL